jgi:hypothetical protein
VSSAADSIVSSAFSPVDSRQDVVPNNRPNTENVSSTFFIIVSYELSGKGILFLGFRALFFLLSHFLIQIVPLQLRDV